MDLDRLLRLNAEGFIPGPSETEEEFEERVGAVKINLEREQGKIPASYWDWPSVQLQALFDFSPRWCAAKISSKGLSPWQGAATWIDVKRVYTIQISQRPWVRLLIDRDELLAHEAVHAARAAFDEPRFEEMFAYLTASAKWRRTIGPLFQRPIEALLFVLLLMGAALLQFAEGAGAYVGWTYFAISLLFFGGGLRLLRQRVRLNRAALRLKPLLREPAKALAVLFRLTDPEIERLSAHLPLEPKPELRWRLLKAAYFRDDAFEKRGDAWQR